LPRGKICEPPRAVQRFESGSCGHKANHEVKIMELARNAARIPLHDSCVFVSIRGSH
jgi:hypothetical protein